MEKSVENRMSWWLFLLNYHTKCWIPWRVYFLSGKCKSFMIPFKNWMHYFNLYIYIIYPYLSQPGIIPLFHPFPPVLNSWVPWVPCDKTLSHLGLSHLQLVKDLDHLNPHDNLRGRTLKNPNDGFWKRNYPFNSSEFSTVHLGVFRAR